MLKLKNCSLLLCSPVNASNITFMVNKSRWKQTTSPWLQFRRNLSTQPQKDYSVWCYVCKSMTSCSPINLAKRSTLQMHSLVLCLIGHRNQVPHISVYRDLENVNFVEDPPISESTLAKFQAETAKDKSLQVLSQVIRSGRPTAAALVPSGAQPFFKYREELTIQNGLVFKGTKITVPESLRWSMETHRSHQGLQAYLQRAREVFFWPGMSAQLKELIEKSLICQSVKPEQASEPLQPHPVPDRPWQRVATDLFTFENRNYLVLVDYFSNFIEIDYLPDTSSLTVIHKLKMHFARHGVPECLVSDSGSQYNLYHQSFDDLQRHGSSSMLLPHRTILKPMDGWKCS